MSSPFDFMFIDFQSAVHCIDNRFDDFVADIVLFNKPSKTMCLLNPKNGDLPKDIFVQMIESKNPILCNDEDFTHETMFFNQNYSHGEDDDIHNIYSWSSICLFFHHDMRLASCYETMIRRGDRMIRYMENFPCLLVYVTKAIDDATNVDAEIMRYYQQASTLAGYENLYFLIVILVRENHRGKHICRLIDNCLFMTKTDDGKNDGTMNFDQENTRICQYFDFQLLETHRETPKII
jgi:hypothetical protein